MKFIYSPFQNPLFIPIVARISLLLLCGFLLTIIIYRFQFRKVVRSEPWLRLWGWVIIAPIFILAVFCGGYFSTLLIFLLMFLALKEYITIIRLPVFFQYLLVFNGLYSIVIAVFYPSLVSLLPVIYFLVVLFCSILRNQLEDIFTYISYTIFGSLWLCFTTVHFFLFGKGIGIEILMLVSFSVALSDVGAYLVGKSFSLFNFGTKFKIARNISPNKTYFGLLGNFLGALLGVFLNRSVLPPALTPHILPLALLISVMSVLGDLTESLVKRFAGVKDTSRLIPGHGGVLDRIDSMILVVVACYYYLTYFI